MTLKNEMDDVGMEVDALSDDDEEDEDDVSIPSEDEVRGKKEKKVVKSGGGGGGDDEDESGACPFTFESLYITTFRVLSYVRCPNPPLFQHRAKAISSRYPSPDY